MTTARYTYAERAWADTGATLVVRKDGLDARAVGARLGCPPGAADGDGGGVPGLWLHERGDAGLGLPEQLDLVVDAVEERASVLRELAAEGHAVSLAAHGRAAAGAVLEIMPQTALRVASLGVPLELSVCDGARAEGRAPGGAPGRQWEYLTAALLITKADLDAADVTRRLGIAPDFTRAAEPGAAFRAGAGCWSAETAGDSVASLLDALLPRVAPLAGELAALRAEGHRIQVDVAGRADRARHLTVPGPALARVAALGLPLSFTAGPVPRGGEGREPARSAARGA
ncbi:DUF4279 domain-containing protein [Streptomyces marincola]|uniref:DUF4279 domain-containing protein n=1 Tax=Streptomyces marincola TaxID=2878388 RepID=UPI001CF3F6C6|nr:DUF4279 domain-containing protein [Streptomyces marincola]UCM89650.1 DUF4279 domain-containing protein [Streptomyces marincola]